ncbi:alginate O-acetyltransferase AlgX-related protein [Hymenobacter sp. BRD67]|uniref:alginate O-acetyltransferase AlgX-related protein n=1 Tax=Hymenobacter sp. BRD67 TaxID=2675877 RepID=UPI001565BACB|nr:hypothetical protein [Hymenobacter sp. BRD67]QKG54066.1 hypothetical protein GKZ67_17505 [Hymenobacter sp. BRD67]
MEAVAVVFPGLKKVLLGLLSLLFVLPALQAKWHLLPVPPLEGYSEPSACPSFSFENLLSDTYQPQFETYLSDRLGFRELAIRLRNQLAYSLFNQVHASDVLLGQHEVLYQGGPTESYLGRDYLGIDALRQHAERVRDVQDSLARHGVQLLYVLAPGKPSYQPEDLPPSVQAIWPGPTNYEEFSHALPKAGVHTLDAAALFKKWKPTAAYPLFPRGGTHWSGYGVTLVADTLFRAIEALTHVDLPDFTTVRPGLVTTDSLRFTDNDIARGLNLLRLPRPYPMAYPVVTFAAPTAHQQRLNALLIGDSFTQSFIGFYPYLSKLLDNHSRFWYYNEYTYWPENIPAESHVVHELNLRQQLEGRQLVLLLTTEQNVSKKSFGFIDEVYNLYHIDEVVK